MNTAHLIKQEMERQGLSINALAEKSLIPRVTLQRKINGGADFTVTEVHHIGKALGVKASALVGDEPKEAAA